MKSVRLLALLVAGGIWALSGLAAPHSWGGPTEMNLGNTDQELLLKVARTAIEAHLRGQAAPPVASAPPHLREPRGAFVSLHRQGSLRGCIGYLEAVKPLMDTIQEMAGAAAFHDPRFAPLQRHEMADLEIEISVLSPMQLIRSTDEIQVGKHGLYMVRGLNRGLLLPQVATHYGWDRLSFLEQTCHKAGLPPDAWKDPATQIYIFTAQIFADHPQKSPAE